MCFFQKQYLKQNHFFPLVTHDQIQVLFQIFQIPFVKMTNSTNNDILIRIAAKTRVSNCVKYTKSLIENNSSEKLIMLQATGSSMNKAISVFEILKREVSGISGDIQLDKISKTNSKNSNSSLKLSRITISLQITSTSINKEKDINQNIQTKKSIKKKQKKNKYLRLGEEKKDKYFVRK
ncbi:hypothetical protein M0812_06712 [Anaeramoeba flamelloides]|uniref:DNA/RNA-binding protein Alba-like domain-containing protein n=1 Tax=Anaeramoeba flamelloides TaxID=1746091 RepID=A0AAV8AAF2_9EUKA|nr:hypothetical protein M0812_06712 [Anaeramoeba flamelloides]